MVSFGPIAVCNKHNGYQRFARSGHAQVTACVISAVRLGVMLEPGVKQGVAAFDAVSAG